MKQQIGSMVLVLVLGGALAGCSDDKSPVCTSADALKSSVDSVKAIDVSTGADVSTLLTGLATVETSFAALKATAKDQFAPEISAVNTALDTVKTSATAAKADPSSTAIQATGTAVTGLTTAVQTLTTEVQTTC